MKLLKKEDIEDYIEDYENGNNNIAEIIKSKARGSSKNIIKMMYKADVKLYRSKDNRTFTLNNSLLKGLGHKELAFFSNDARSGLAEKKLETAKGGEFTRRIVEILYDVKFSNKNEDSYTEMSIEEYKKLINEVISDMNEKDIKINNNDLIFDFLKLRINPDTGKAFIKQEIEDIIEKKGKIKIISPAFSDNLKDGIIPVNSVGVYSISSEELYNPNYRIGLIAATTIGEQATQLSMKSFQGGKLVAIDEIKSIINDFFSNHSGEIDRRELLKASMKIYSLYSSKVRPQFIELLIGYVTANIDTDKKFKIDSFQSIPWKNTFSNMLFGYVSNQFKNISCDEIEKISINNKYKLVFNKFKGEIDA